MKKLTCGIMAGVMLISITGTALADDDLEQQLEDVKARAARQQEITNEAAARVDSISEQVRIVEEEAREATKAYLAVKSQLDNTQAKIDDNQELLEKTEEELKGKRRLLQKRVRDIYINGQISYVDVLFGAKDFSDLITRMDILKRIIKHDYELVMVVREKQNVIKTARAELEKDKEALHGLVEDAAKKKMDMEDKKAGKIQLLNKAKTDKATSEQAYAELVAASQQIANLIRQSQMAPGHYSGPAPSGSGGMVWPLSGPITSEYGWRTHPIYGTSRFHSGLDIGGDYGEPIYAAASGTVIQSGWISG